MKFLGDFQGLSGKKREGRVVKNMQNEETSFMDDPLLSFTFDQKDGVLLACAGFDPTSFHGPDVKK